MIPIASPPADIRNISPQEYCQQSPPPLLIDVRTRLEYRLFHAPEAVNLSLPRLLLGRLPLLGWLWPHWLRQLPKDQPIALVCLTAHRSPIAAQQLVAAGFRSVFNLTGGMRRWRQDGLPTVTGKSGPAS